MKKNLLIFLSFLITGIIRLTAQNLVSNGDFEGGTLNWSTTVANGGASTFTYPTTGDVHGGSGSMRANVTAVGSNAWDVQVIHSGFTATPSIAHTLTFWARATVAGRQARIVLQNSTYTAQDITLTTTWTQYTFNFTPTESSLQIKLHFYQTGDFRFDNFVINDPSGGPALVTSVLTPATTYQTMVGFGGALTWYSERMFAGPNQNAISDIIFTDLGIDILRLKTWYYPNNYPTNKTTTTMNPTWFKTNFDRTNQLYTMAKARVPGVEVLLCSWSPPQSQKSNNLLPEGTLKQNAGQFMYKEFAQYWVDILDNISFDPDYITIQNEPGYVNPGWETCEWRPTETAGLPGLDVATDSVYNRIKDRPDLPKILAPEVENLGGAGWNASLNTFREFANPMKTRSYVYGYNYHLYNYAGGAGSISPANLNIIKNEFNNKPNFMTEFSSSNYNWIDAARMVHANLVEANTSAYIYWELVWDNASASTMVGLDAAGNYTIKDNFYSIKHYSKFIDKGHVRMAATGSNSTLNITAFRNPSGNQITVVVINNHVSPQPLNLSLAGGATISSAQAYQSVANNYWQNLGTVNLAATQSLPGKSLTTYVINTSPLPITLLSFTGKAMAESNLLEWKTSFEENNDHFDVMHSLNGKTFECIGTVAAKGNSTSLQSYSFIHENPTKETHYYQLKQVDVSGQSSVSDIIHISNISPLNTPIHFPEPFQDNFTLANLSDWIGAEYTIKSIQGITLLEGKINGLEKEIDMNDFSSGTYIITLKSEKGESVFRVTKNE
jgi:hypothetical protein